MSTIIEIGLDFEENDLSSTITTESFRAISSDEVCVLCKNKFGYPDLEWMSRTSGVSVNLLVLDLRGTAIFQDLDAFEGEEHWDILRGWKYAEQYLCGNIARKLAEARAMNDKFAYSTYVNTLDTKS